MPQVDYLSEQFRVIYIEDRRDIWCHLVLLEVYIVGSFDRSEM
jgi:hypothetical protein